MTQTKQKIPVNLVQRIILERDLTDSKEIVYTTPDGKPVSFVIRTLTMEEKQKIRSKYDQFFPIPPVVQGKLGAPQFDLEEAQFQEALLKWNADLSRGVLAATLGVDDASVTLIEASFPREFVNRLFATIELLNGIQSDPLTELVREALWAPEVVTWLETSPDKGDGIKLSDTPLFREMEAMNTARLTLSDWEKLSPRHKIMYMNYHAYKAAREAYITDQSEKRAKDKAARRV